MLIASFVKLICSIIVLIISCFFIDKTDVILIVSQTILSSYIFEETTMLTIYNSKMKKIYDQAYNQLVTIGVKDKKQKIWLLWYTIEYETIKAYYKVRLDTKLFNKYNAELSKQWDTIKNKISISSNEKSYIVTIREKTPNKNRKQ